MEPAADVPSGSSLAEVALMLRLVLEERGGEPSDDPRFARLRLALDQLFNTATADVASLDEDAVVALTQANIVLPVTYFDETASTWKFRFLLDDGVALASRNSPISRLLVTRNRDVALALNAMSSLPRTMPLELESIFVGGSWVPLNERPSRIIPPPAGAQELESKDLSVGNTWRRLLDRLLIGRAKLRSPVPAAALAQERLEDGVESATHYVDMVLNLLGPPPEGLPTAEESSPLVPTGVS